MEESQAISIAVNEYAIGAFIGYLLLLVGIGIYSTRFSSAGISNFFIGGRKMNRFVVALSAVVSGRSSWLMLGATGMAYAQGASAIWAVVGYTIVELLLFLYYAKRLRNFSETYDCITVPDFFAERFNDHKGYLRLALVLVFLIFMVSYVSAQFVAGGKAFASSFGIDQTQGLLITAAIVLVYTVLGGFLAVSLTDMFQAIFMIFALVILPIIAIADYGGLTAVLNELQQMQVGFVDPIAISIGGFLGFVGIGLGSPGNPHILSRYMSIDDPKQLQWTAIVGTIWNVLMGWGAILIGIVGKVYFPETSMLPASDTENLYPVLAQQHLHPIIFGVVVASIFAAIMSTSDSQLLVAASAVVRDIYDKILKQGEELSQRLLVFYSRLVVFLLVVCALIFALYAQELVFWLVLFAWSGLGASIGPTSILALYWRGTSWAGALCGVISGTLVTIIWYSIPVLKDNLYELIPAFLVSTLVTIIVSKYTQKPEGIDRAFREMTK